MTEAKPLISIVTPTYNRADFIGRMIDSVLAQTCPDFELIIIDDGSTDGTRELVEGYGDDRIIYRYQENSGQSNARNVALGLARGEFVCFLDSDNEWLPEKLEKSLRAFEQHPDADVVYGDCITIDEHGNEITRENMRRHSGYIAPLMLRDNFISMNTTMTRRRCFDESGGMSATRRVADDYDLWLRFSARYRFLYLPEFLARYRVMADQISSDKELRFRTNEEIIREFLRANPGAVTRRQAREGLAIFYVRKARYLAGSGMRGRALLAIFRAFLLAPFAAPTWRGLYRVLVTR